MVARGEGKSEDGCGWCGSFLPLYQPALVCGIGRTDPVNTSRQPVDTSGYLIESPRYPITSNHDYTKAKKSEIMSFFLESFYISLGFPIDISCISLEYARFQ